MQPGDSAGVWCYRSAGTRFPVNQVGASPSAAATSIIRSRTMLESVILVNGPQAARDTAGTMSLMNAKQLVLGRLGKDGTVLHVAATTEADLQKALLAFAHVTGMTGVMTLAIAK